MNITYETTLDNLYQLHQLQGEMAVIENNQIRMGRELKEPFQEVQERTDREIVEFLDSCNDDEWDDHFQNGGGHE